MKLHPHLGAGQKSRDAGLPRTARDGGSSRALLAVQWECGTQVGGCSSVFGFVGKSESLNSYSIYRKSVGGAEQWGGVGKPGKNCSGI